MMILRLFVAAAIAATAIPATAQTVFDTHTESGAMAGRSPHKAYRPIAATSRCETKALPSLPGGKLPVYGRPATPDHCRDLARADAAPGIAAGEQ